MVYQSSLQIKTGGRGMYPIKRDVEEQLTSSGIHTGIGLVFLHHTSASLVLCENADPEVQAAMQRMSQAMEKMEG